jgi:hypothetical protein
MLVTSALDNSGLLSRNELNRCEVVTNPLVWTSAILEKASR